MNKKLLVFLLLSNVAVGCFLVIQTLKVNELKKAVITQYIQSQNNINDLLRDALEQYKIGNEERFKSNLHLANAEFQTVTNLIGNSTPIGEKIGVSESIWSFHSKGKNIIHSSFEKSISGEITKEEIGNIEDYLVELNHFAKQLTLIYLKGSPDKVLGNIEEILNKSI